MAHSLHNLQRPASNKRAKKRLGRGNASGKGTYSGKGLKGQKARSGGRARLKRRATFQQFLIRTPKLRGFKRQSAAIAIINLSVLDKRFKDGDKVTPEVLIKAGLVRGTAGGVKILGSGEIAKKLTVKAHFFSASAKSAIEAAGGNCETI